jgi:ABC-type bacteriocin/lantibiotic exporter with double-glycine peptidase domain
METRYVVWNGSTGTFLVTASQVLEIKGGEFTWSKDTPSPTLEDINLIVRKGELTGIVGRVGAGKVCRNMMMLNSIRLEADDCSRASFRQSLVTCAGLKAR